MAIEIGATLSGRFLLQKELGRGGMGAVYAALDQVLERSVAIKVLKDQTKGGAELARRLRVEAQIAARLLHDNIVRIYDFGESEGLSFLVMEQVDGSCYIRRWREVPLGARLRILAGVADALDYAHRQGVIHRDVKPGNVLLTAADAPKLSDFGLSLLAEQEEAAGVVRGTPHYMSPEQAKGKRLTHRTDLYSLGVMLYESATGSVPFTGTPVSVMMQHSSAPPPTFSRGELNISAGLERLIFDLLAKEPESRPASGATVAAILREEAAKLGDAEIDESATVAVPAAPALDLGALAELGEGRAVESSLADASRSRADHSSKTLSRIEVVEAVDLAASPLVRKMLRTVLAEPVSLSADERYLMGYYLAYLLVGSRRGRLLERRRLEGLNADRARLILALTYALTAADPDEAVLEAAALLDQQIEVRPALNPVVLAKFLSWRDTPNRRKLLRKTRKAIQEASAHARAKMTDARGTLNPGLIPRSLDDLRKIAPRAEVGDDLIERWNRLADAWREHPDLREAALRYASGAAHRDPSGAALWAEVVYPLIEMARSQRRNPRLDQRIRNFLGGLIPGRRDPGAELNRLLARDVPSRVVARIDHSAEDLDAILDQVEPKTSQAFEDPLSRLAVGADVSRLEAITDQPQAVESDLVELADPEPSRFLQGELNELWRESLDALQRGPGAPPAPGARRGAPLGPYRLVVVASVRAAKSGQIIIQGMANKQIELSTPSLRGGGSKNRPILAAWLYRDNSLLIAHLDFKGTQRHVLWDAPRARQETLNDPDEVRRELDARRMAVPEQLESALSRWYRPKSRA